MSNYTTYEPAVSRPSSGVASPHKHMRSRTQSISSDRPSLYGLGLMSPPLSVTPEAAFIAASAASQIVTNDHDQHAATWYDEHNIAQSAEPAFVSPAALRLVNNFLDQLLFNFLLASHGTTLSSLRPAVVEVLKPKLAKDAINQADEELREYLGGADQDELTPPGNVESPQDWDLELVWKRTRLRCMVYSSLGDMEDEEEDFYMEQEELGPDALDGPSDVISPAVAIFLTSILEFMGEQALVIAGQAAYQKMRLRYEKEMREGVAPPEIVDRIVVDELDMERVALDRTLGRLWRAWKKRIRSPTWDAASPRSFSRNSRRGSHARQLSVENGASSSTLREGSFTDDKASVEEESPDVEEVIPADIFIPVGERDVDEIEVPGLVSYSDDEDDEDDLDLEYQLPQRPKSLTFFSHQPSSPVLSSPSSPWPPSEHQASHIGNRQRSNSVPTAAPGLAAFLAKLVATPAIDGTPAADDDGSKEEEEAVSIPEDSAAQEDAVQQEEAVESTGPAIPERAARRDANRLSQIIVDRSAMTASATSLTRGEEVQDNGELKDGEDDGHFEILTSSRISVGGISPVISDSGRALSALSTNSSSTRPPSMHSPRLIDVPAPRTPITRSRTSSIEAQDQVRPENLSRSNSTTQPAVIEETGPYPAADDVVAYIPSAPVVIARAPFERGTHRSLRQSTNHAISEEEEDVETSSAARTRDAPITPQADSVVPERLQTKIATSQAIFGSAVRASPTSSPRSARTASSPPPASSPQEEYVTPTVTKVTILSTSNSNGPFVESSPPEYQSQSRAYSGSARDRPTPASSTPPAASIGLVSVIESAEESVLPPTAPRQTHTSGSSTSSNTKRKAVRTSEESGSLRSENVARNFEELIQSDQTIQYTLTPESMRDMDSTASIRTSSPVLTTKSRRSEEVRSSTRNRSRSSSNSTEPQRTTSISRSTGLVSQPIHSSAASASGSTSLKGPIPRAPYSGTATNARSRMGAPQAREARTSRQSVLDMADFIRSTGPAGAVDAYAPPVRSATSASATGYPKSSMDSRMTSSSIYRPRLQARDAAVDSREDNSDLIDFIRQGPPSAGNPRIPRTVAPFRTTMDSDQMSGAVGGRAVDATLPDLRYGQNAAHVTDSAPSMHSSINSQSALLKSRASQQNANTFDDDDMMPKRKTRRVRDPYTLDFSDDEEESFRAPPPVNAPPREESLADFLRNYPPPPEPVQTPLHQKIPKKKASAPSLMARFTRSSSSHSSTAPSLMRGNAADTRPMTSRTSSGKGYIPIQVNMPPGYDKYGLIDTNLTPKTSNASTGRVAMRKFEPREAVPSSSRTSDLAAFLLNSEPPSSNSGGPRSRR